MSVTQLLGGLATPPGQPQIVSGIVSRRQPAPANFTDPLFVVLEDFDPDHAFQIDNWPAIHGATLPALGASVLVIFDDRHTVRIVWWDGQQTAGGGGVSTFNGRAGAVVPVSGDYTATQVTGAERTANKGAASGYAALDGSTKVPIGQLPTGATGSTVAIGNDSRITGAVQAANNGSDFASAATTRSNLGLGTAATHPAGDFELAANKGAASGYMGLDAGARGAQAPKLHATDHQPGGADAMAVDAASGTGSLRTLGSSSTQAAAGNDSRFPQLAVLTADLSAISSQTTLQNLTGLGLSIGASATEMWLVKYWLLVSAANTTMDVKFGFTVPASCTMKGGAIQGTGQAVGGWIDCAASVAPIAMNTQATTPAFGTANLTNGIVLTYIVFGGGTSGTVQLQYAQNTSDAGNLQILKGSAMEAVKLAA